MAAVITSSDFITAVLFGVPGHVGAAATVIDGHAMARKGEAGRAFGAGFAASLAGGIVGAIVLAVSIPILRPVMLAIGSPELLGFHPVRHVHGGDAVGPRAAQGADRRRPRPDDRDGRFARADRHAALDLRLALSVGRRAAHSGDARYFRAAGTRRACGVAQAHRRRQRADINLSSQWDGVRDVGRHWWLVLRCGVLGTGLGAIPGIGSAVIDWIAYGYAQRTEKNPETFGTGDVRGVIAPESSNNAKEGGHLVPTIAFGVPAGASMAILLGAFLMHGLTPGPEMLTKHLDVTYTIVWSLTLAHVIGAVICLACSRWLAKISRVRPEILLPVIIALVFVAAFEGEHDWGDLYSLVFFGVVGWIMKRLGWPRPPHGARPRGRRHFRALPVHLDAALRLGLADAAGGAGDPGLRRVGAVSAVGADRGDADRRLREVGGRIPLRRGAGVFARVIVLIVAAMLSVCGLAARRQARAADRLRHGAGRRRAQSHQ